MKFKDKLKYLGYISINEDNTFFVNKESEINYSDGEVETKIFETLLKLPENGFENEDDLENSIVDWPTKYHFGWERTNILKPINFTKNDRVLELGGGTGALSNFILNKVESLVTIEGTVSRAKSIIQRCKNSKNINVIVADFLQLNLIDVFGEKSFDKITLIGVLEYTPKYSKQKDDDPIKKLLFVCNKLLKEQGELIIAIENKIGLKYILGWQEDHIGLEYYGPQSLYKRNDTTTFSKSELQNRLTETGFNDNSFYYPFPDYKLPSVIIRESEDIYSKQLSSLMISLLYDIKSCNYSGKNSPEIHEGRVIQNFIENNSLGVVSNSFLILSKKEKTIKPKINVPSIYYYSTKRKYKYANEIKFTIQESIIRVSKKWYGNKTSGNILNLMIGNTIEYDLTVGENVHILLDNYYLLNQKEEYTNLFTNWINFVKEHLKSSKDYTFDMVPNNTIINLKKDFRFIDLEEWKSSKKLSLSVLVYRYIAKNKSHFIWLLSSVDEKNNEIDYSSFFEYFKLPFPNQNEINYLHKINEFIRVEIARKKYKFKTYKKPKNKSFGLVIKNITPPIILRLLKKLIKF